VFTASCNLVRPGFESLRMLHARAHRAAGRLLNGPDGVRDPTRAPDPAR